MNESQIASAADKTSPLKAKKPFWKRWWFWLIVVIAVLAVAGIGTNTAKGPAAQTQSSQTNAPAESDDKAESAPSKPEADVPAEYANALKSAENYSDMMHMSRQAIYNQLTSEFDQFSAEAAQYAVDNLQADYNANALAKAGDYSDTMHMSRQGIYDQLTSEFDQFTAEEAQYAVDNLQADYNANALASAKNYQETMAMSPEAIRDQLTSEYGGKFTQEEADYAIAHLND